MGPRKIFEIHDIQIFYIHDIQSDCLSVRPMPQQQLTATLILLSKHVVSEP